MASSATVVVGTDLSASANRALHAAAALARREDKKLVVVHVAPETVFSRLEPPRVSSALFDRVAAIAPDGLDFEVVVDAGSAHARLIALSDERNADLLVVGASGAGGVERLFFGSTAEQVVRYAHCDVLVVRQSAESGAVLAATDFSEAATLAVHRAGVEARRRGAALVLLHSLYEPPSLLDALGPLVMTPPAASGSDWEAKRYGANSTLESLLATEKTDGQCIVSEEAPVTAVQRHAKELGVALVVVGTHGRSGLARVALGSVAERVARETPCSVLVVRPKSA